MYYARLKKLVILLKISGEALKGNSDLIDMNFVDNLVEQIVRLNQKYAIAIVLGGGNIFRMCDFNVQLQIARYKADQIGMLATMMNSLVLQSKICQKGLDAEVFSTIEMPKIAHSYVIDNVQKAFLANKVVFLACGTGRPYFTTDTGIAVAAAELKARYILMGKNKVDGVYDKDPIDHPDAVFFPRLTYKQIIQEELKVMDITAASICKQNNIQTLVFKINTANVIFDVLHNRYKHTLITN